MKEGRFTSWCNILWAGNKERRMLFAIGKCIPIISPNTNSKILSSLLPACKKKPLGRNRGALQALVVPCIVVKSHTLLLTSQNEDIKSGGKAVHFHFQGFVFTANVRDNRRQHYYPLLNYLWVLICKVQVKQGNHPEAS